MIVEDKIQTSRTDTTTVILERKNKQTKANNNNKEALQIHGVVSYGDEASYIQKETLSQESKHCQHQIFSEFCQYLHFL